MQPLTIRDAVPSDLETVIAFNLAMALETEQLTLTPDVLRRGVEAVLTDKSKGHYLVAEVEGSVVGQLMLTYEWSDWRNGTWFWIQSVYVTPHHRRHGVFSRLYREVITRAENARAAGIRLYVEKENATAQRTYAALGMSETRYVMFESKNGAPTR